MCSELDIRPVARAVIRKGGLVLVQVKERADGRRYLTLPGGRQEAGETARDCLRRECLEEIGAAPEIGELLHAADVFRHRPDVVRHSTELLFACTLLEDYTPRLGTGPDTQQVDTIWADPQDMGSLFVPRYDIALCDDEAPIYLGALHCETA